MVGVLLISHGLLCQGLADSVSMVAGNIEQSECISLKPGQDPGEFKEKVRQAVEELDTGMGVLVLTDLLGGTPFNSIAMLCQVYPAAVITGANMAMGIAAALQREEGTTLSELAEICEQAGHDGIKRLDIQEKGTA